MDEFPLVSRHNLRHVNRHVHVIYILFNLLISSKITFIIDHLYVCSAIVFWDPTLLTFFSSISLIIVLADYIAPFVMPRVFDPALWNAQKERQLNETCSQLAASYMKLKSDACHFYNLKDTRPKLVIKYEKLIRSRIISHILFLQFLLYSITQF